MTTHLHSVLAQGSEFAPEAPPYPDRVLTLFSYLAWFHLLMGVAAVLYVGAGLAWERATHRRNRATRALLCGAIAGVLAAAVGLAMHSAID